MIAVTIVVILLVNTVLLMPDIGGLSTLLAAQNACLYEHINELIFFLISSISSFYLWKIIFFWIFTNCVLWRTVLRASWLVLHRLHNCLICTCSAVFGSHLGAYGMQSGCVSIQVSDNRSSRLRIWATAFIRLIQTVTA